MRRAAMLVFVLGCHHGEPQTTPPVAHEDVVPELTCPPTAAPSKLRGVDPQQGGYLVAQSDAELDRWRAAMAHGTTDTNVASRNLRTMWAAVDDLRPEIQHCMVAADGTHPDVQYELRMGVNSNSVATLITSVSLQRIDGVGDDHTPVLGKTAAESCAKSAERWRAS